MPDDLKHDTDEFSEPEDIYIEAAEESDLVALVRDILRPKRAHAVVVLTSTPGESEPALDAVAIKRLVGDRVPLWFVPGELSYQLTRRLPRGLGVHNGAARIFWPGVDKGSNGGDHPLIRPHGSERSILRRFRDVWQGGPVDPDRLPTAITAELRRLREELAHVHEEAARLARQVAEADTRADQAEARARAADRRSRGLEQLAAGDDTDEVDDEDRFRLLVLKEWLRITESSKHHLWPARFKFGPDFMRDLDRSKSLRRRIAWVCALVISGRAHELEGLQVHPLRTGPGGDDPQRVRAYDGARAWRCSVKRNTPGAARLHWWELKDGDIEFANVRHHDRFHIS